MRTLLLSGVTSHRQLRQWQGAQGPKTVKGAQSDPNYVSRLLARSECLPEGPKIIVTTLLLLAASRVESDESITSKYANTRASDLIQQYSSSVCLSVCAFFFSVVGLGDVRLSIQVDRIYTVVSPAMRDERLSVPRPVLPHPRLLLSSSFLRRSMFKYTQEQVDRQRSGKMCNWEQNGLCQAAELARVRSRWTSNVRQSGCYVTVTRALILIFIPVTSIVPNCRVQILVLEV